MYYAWAAHTFRAGIKCRHCMYRCLLLWLCYLSSCLKETLLVGGYQVALHSGMPDQRRGIEAISSSDLDASPSIPACTILLRILPRSEKFIPAPSYSTGYYRNAGTEPSASEYNVLHSYTEDDDKEKTIGMVAKAMYSAAKAENTGSETGRTITISLSIRDAHTSKLRWRWHG